MPPEQLKQAWSIRMLFTTWIQNNTNEYLENKTIYLPNNNDND